MGCAWKEQKVSKVGKGRVTQTRRGEIKEEESVEGRKEREERKEERKRALHRT